MLHHFILTRFNIRLFRHDKHGHSIEPKSWFEERLNLFETYTLPSIMGQTCQEFTWICGLQREDDGVPKTLPANHIHRR